MKFGVRGEPTYAYTGGRPLFDGQPLLVLVHGAQHDHSVWGLQSRYLAHHGCSVLALDLPGHGRSAGRPLQSVEQMAQWLCEAVEAACKAAGLAAVPPALVAGHSMGSLVALELSGLAPRWLRAIGLLATAVPMRVSEALLDAARLDEDRAFDMINFWSSAGINHRPGSPGPGFSTYVQNRRLMERQQPGVLHTDFQACNAYAAGLERAGALALPVLFMLAGRDQMTPPKAAARAIAAARAAGADVAVVEVEGSGHNLMAEHPEATLAGLGDWVGRVLASGVDPAASGGDGAAFGRDLASPGGDVASPSGDVVASGGDVAASARRGVAAPGPVAGAGPSG